MAFLSWRTARSPLLASSAAIVAVGCSFVLDTNDLQKGGDAAANPTGTGGGSGAPAADAAQDAPMCLFPERDACSDCLGMHCCGETNGCTHDASCNLAYVDFQVCQRNAKKATNPMVASTACGQIFRNHGGTPADVLVGCTLTNCSTVCGG